MLKPMTNQLLGRVVGGEGLSQEEMAAVMGEIMQGRWKDEEIALLLTGLRAKGETIDEIAGAALALRRHMTPIRTTYTTLLDTCGTGGDGSQTFNISTAAALVAAAAGVRVAKHGNRGITSKSGSANVLAELGVNIEADRETVEACLEEVGICFCFAPLLHPSMRHVAAVRQKLGVPTIFNILGPLANPAGAPFQLLGVGRAELRPILADVLLRLGTQRALIVSGEDGLDEVTLGGVTHVSRVAEGSVTQFAWTPEEFGIARGSLEPLRVESAAQSAEIILAVLRGRTGPARDIVVINAAAALVAAGHADEPRRAARQAEAALVSGAAEGLLQRLVERSGRA
jgi:anthranilate phosphoribosyltransferase